MDNFFVEAEYLDEEDNTVYAMDEIECLDHVQEDHHHEPLNADESDLQDPLKETCNVTDYDLNEEEDNMVGAIGAKSINEMECLDYAREAHHQEPPHTDESNLQDSLEGTRNVIDYNLDNDDKPLETDENIFIFTGVFCRKLYRSQLRPKEYAKQNVRRNSVQEVLDSIWSVAKKQVHRAIVFENEIPRFADDDPNQEDMGSFVTLQDALKKKLYSVSAITPRLLRNWRGKTFKILVYVYSSSVENNTQYQLIQRKLIAPQNPDRSGANSTLDESTLAYELRDGHPEIDGHRSSWLLWANHTNSSPVHERDRMKLARAPPLELAKYFRWTAVSEAARLQAVHRGLVVAHTVNQSWSKEITEVKKDVDLAVSILQGVVNRLSVMENRANVELELFTAMTSATQPEERELSRTLAERVVDCVDVDHS